MAGRPRRNHSRAFKAKVAVAAIKGARTMIKLAREFDVQPPEHDLYPAAASIAALVVLDGLAARLPARDAGLYPLVLQRISEPVSVMAPIGQQPLCAWQAAQQGGCARVVTDLTWGHVEADRAAFRVGDGVQFGAHAAFGSTDQTAPLVVGLPFFDRRPVAVRYAFKWVAPIITVFGTAASEAGPSIIRAKMPLSLRYFQRL